MSTETPTRRGSGFGRFLWGLSVALLISSAGVYAEAATEIECGDVLRGHKTYALTGDLECNTGEPALTVVGPATLKLNGWSVICEPEIDGSIGIKLVGRGASLLGGSFGARGANPTPRNKVTGCAQNVVVEGRGEHVLKGVTATRAGEAGFVVNSDENELVGNMVVKDFDFPVIEDDPEDPQPAPSGGNGFAIAGDKNVLLRNVAADNEDDDAHGFLIEGERNRLAGNIARDNFGGFNIEGANNILENNAALKNIDNGFLVGPEAKRNNLTYNKSSENGDPDEPEGCTESDGFEVLGDDNVLKYNTADTNCGFGIYLNSSEDDLPDAQDTAQDNVVYSNAALNSGVIDLHDDKDRCGSNEWSRNVFGTRSRACIR